MHTIAILSEVNNREIATAFWLLIVLLWALPKSGIRHSIFQFVKAFFRWKIIIPFIIMGVYIFIIVLIFKKTGFWDLSACKDTILWSIGVAVTTFINLNRTLDEKNFFVNFLTDNIKFFVILEFIIHLYAFPLLVELFFVPIVTVTAVLKSYVSGKQEFKIVEPFLNALLGFAGIVIIFFTIREIIIDFSGFATLKNFRDLLLPLFLSIAFLPYIYTMALYMMYESLFIRISLANHDKDLERYAKMKVLLGYNINLSRLKKFSKLAGYPKIQSKEAVLTWLSKR